MSFFLLLACVGSLPSSGMLLEALSYLLHPKCVWEQKAAHRCSCILKVPSDSQDHLDQG